MAHLASIPSDEELRDGSLRETPTDPVQSSANKIVNAATSVAHAVTGASSGKASPDESSKKLSPLAKLELEPKTMTVDPTVLNVYGSKYATQEIPKNEMPQAPMPKEVAYQLIKDEMTLDGVPSLNLASFVTTHMEREAEKLMSDAQSKNFIDYEEYPVCADIQDRCVSMLGRLYHCPTTGEEDDKPLGTSTVGSSEAIMLGVLAMKRRWQIQRKAHGLPCDKPNLIMASSVQVCWKKACVYFEVEEKYVKCTETRYILDPKEAVALVDENTIGICAILGSTYTGEYEDVQGLNDLLMERELWLMQNKPCEKGFVIDVPIHVDAASGGFVAPFVYPELKWDFRLPKVASINVSGHKYGLVYAGVGWCIWREPKYLPQELIFMINYLGAEQSSFTLNFSRGASQIVGQYYQLIRLGKEGYTDQMRNLTRISTNLSNALEEMGFIIMSQKEGYGLPLVACRLDPAKNLKFDEFAVSHKLRERNWIVPAYTMAANAEHIQLMRVVVRSDFTETRCMSLIAAFKQVLKDLGKLSEEHLRAQLEMQIQTKQSMQRKPSMVAAYASSGKGPISPIHEANGRTTLRKPSVSGGIC